MKNRATRFLAEHLRPASVRGGDVADSIKNALGKARRAAAAQKDAANRTGTWIEALPSKARKWPLADPSPGTPPELPNPAEVLAQARKKASQVGAITAGVATWRESADLYRRYQSGESLTLGTLWDSTRRVGKSAAAASQAASRRHMVTVGLNSVAKVVAWQTARRAGDNALWKVIHNTSKKLSGRAGLVLMAVDVYKTMQSDLDRYRDGQLSQDEFYRNCALTGVGVAAPLVGSTAGPVGTTVGIAVAVSAGMMRK